MTSSTYSRLYHRLMTEYPSVWRSPVQLGLYVQLLVAADKFYPEWPTSNRRNGAYQSLLKAGLVIEKEGTDGYTVLGLEADRERRSHAARTAAAARYGMPKREEKSKEEKSSGNGIANGNAMGWRSRPSQADALADIERQHAASLEDAIAKHKQP